MKWYNLEINIQNVKYETLKATLIKMPNKSEYAGYSFWHPNKLIRNGSNSHAIKLGYNDQFVFRLKKYGKGKHNSNDVIDEIEIDATDFEEAFECMRDCTRDKSPETYLHITEPKKVDKIIEVKDELKNNHKEINLYEQ